MWLEFFLTIVFFGILVIGILMLIQIKNQQQKQPVEIIIHRPWFPPGPYYSHLPVRPLVY